MSYNPYDLISVKINGQPFTARPIEFDSEIIDAKESTNFFGRPVKPIKISTLCPDCGQGLIINVELDDPPFKELELRCSECNPEIINIIEIDPFINPVEVGLIVLEESGKKSKLELKPKIIESKLNYEFDLTKPDKTSHIPLNEDIDEEIEFDDHELVDDDE